MEATFLPLVLIALAAIIAGVFYIIKALRDQQTSKQGDQSFLLIQNQINELNRVIENKLGESSKVLREEFGASARMVRELTKEITQELTKVGEGHKQVLTITEQLKNLQDILKNPKQRGVLGEYFLESVLQNVLPPGSYQMQYAFKDGVIVDAVIFYQGKMIPIDSKFSLENYNRILESKTEEERRHYEDAFRNDLKMRIDETAKYVKPEEDTYDFAFMFIPSEAIYYDLLVNKVGAVNARDLIEYAQERKVYPVSPVSFFAFLQTVIQGLKQIEFNRSAEEIRKRVDELRKHVDSYETYFKRLGTHLGTTVNTYNNAYKELKKIDKDVVKITGKSANVEPVLIEGPADGE